MAGNITVRLWSDEELRKIRTGEDDYLATIFMNCCTFSAKEIASYPYNRRREYWVTFNDGSGRRVYATDDDQARAFIEAQYHYDMVDSIMEVITTSREVAV